MKIDRSFVQHAAIDEQDGMLVRTITELGQGLGLRVVAEGAEDDATVEVLRSAGVDSVQGYGIPADAGGRPAGLAGHQGRERGRRPLTVDR